MTTRKRPGRDLRELCARAHDEDGIDPRYIRNEGEEARPTSRKDMQLCKQVWRALSASLEGCAGPVLTQLDILSVEPAPHTGRLRITVSPRAGAVPMPGQVVLEHLARARGYLRSQLVGIVMRERIPEHKVA